MSALAIYTIGGVTLGPQVGGLPSDFMLLIMSRNGVEAVLKGKIKSAMRQLPREGSAARHMLTVEGMDILTYGESSGPYPEISFGVAILDVTKLPIASTTKRSPPRRS